MKKKFLLLLTVLLTFVTITSANSQKERNHTVMKESESVIIGGETKSLTAFTQIYSPHIYLNKKYQSPDLLYLNYEVVDKANFYIIRFHIEWEDEIVPNKLLDQVYRVIRRIVYGPSNSDIEFLQIDVDKKSAEIIRVLFETKEEAKSYNSNHQEHLIIDIRKNKETFEKSLKEKGKNGNVLNQQNLGFKLKRKIHLESITWNHLLGIIEKPDSNLQLLEYKTRYLDDTAYVEKRYAKRSQGDYEI